MSSITTGELAVLLDVPTDQVRRRLHAFVRRGQWVTPARGLWVPVPPEFRTWGAPPGLEIVDQMMRHLDVDYYVGWLSAAALHGASHHAPQVFQVAVTDQVRDRSVGRTRFSFAQRAIDPSMTQSHSNRAGSAVISTVACTMLDIATDVGRAGGINNAATAIVELAESDGFDLQGVVRLGPRYPAASLRRMGWVLEHFSQMSHLESLRTVAVGAPQTPSRLVPAGSASGPVDTMWRVYVNGTVEPDL